MLLVLLLFGAPGVLFMLILYAIPLQDPRAGWNANLGFWVRNFVTVIAITCVTLNQTQVVVPELKLSTARIIAIAAGVTIPYTFALMAVAHHWMFSVPFTLTLGAIPCGMCTDLLVATSLGCANKQLIEKYLSYSRGVFVQMTMLIIYPTYSAIFLSLEGIPQLAFVLLLPVMKLGFKFITMKVQYADDDLLTALQSSVDLFDALYMTKCMQSAGTFVVGFGIIMVDLAQNYAAIHILAKQT